MHSPTTVLLDCCRAYCTDSRGRFFCSVTDTRNPLLLSHLYTFVAKLLQDRGSFMFFDDWVVCWFVKAVNSFIHALTASSVILFVPSVNVQDMVKQNRSRDPQTWLCRAEGRIDYLGVIHTRPKCKDVALPRSRGLGLTE